MPEPLKPDICVIGAGSGGLSVAAAAAAFGVSVVLVEKGRMGGDCLNQGCVPSKSLIAAARHARAIAEAGRFGLSVPPATVDFAQVHRHLHEVIAAIAPNDSKERYTGLGVKVIEGTARFKNRRAVAVGDDIEIRARRFVLATGSVPLLPPIPGLDTTAHLTNETVFDLTTRPEHLIVIGAGPIGLELAQAFRRLGAGVTVLDTSEPLAQEDPECAAVVRDQLAREGVDIRQVTEILRVETLTPSACPGKVDAGFPTRTCANARSESASRFDAGGMRSNVAVVVREEAGEQTIIGSHLLVAAGRRANTQALDLKQGRIRCDGDVVRIGAKLRTSNRRVYAVGDVAGGASTHAANYHAGIVIRNVLFRQGAKVDPPAIPRVTFTDPELAHIGLSEVEARARAGAIRVLRWPYHENDRAQAERATQGHIKVVADARGRILGATIVGSAAGELITAWTLAVSQGLNLRAFAGIVVPYPTLSEIGKRAALSYFTPSLTRNWVRRIVGLLRRFG